MLEFYKQREFQMKLSQYSQQVIKLFKRGLITEQEILEHNKDYENLLIGIAKSRKLSQRFLQRIKDD